MNLSESQARLVRSLADQGADMLRHERAFKAAGVPNDFYAGCAIGFKTAAKHAAFHFKLANRFGKKFGEN